MLDTEAIITIRKALLEWSVRTNTPVSEIRRQLSNLQSMASACSDDKAAASLKLLDFSM